MRIDLETGDVLDLYAVRYRMREPTTKIVTPDIEVLAPIAFKVDEWGIHQIDGGIKLRRRDVQNGVPEITGKYGFRTLWVPRAFVKRAIKQAKEEMKQVYSMRVARRYEAYQKACEFFTRADEKGFTVMMDEGVKI